jgi:hypothetical protein
MPNRSTAVGRVKSSVGRGPLGDLVDVVLLRHAGADIEELPDAGILDQVGPLGVWVAGILSSFLAWTFAFASPHAGGSLVGSLAMRRRLWLVRGRCSGGAGVPIR